MGIESRMDRMRGWIRGSWTYPENAVLAKTLSLDMEAGNPASRRRIETQLLHFDGASWQAYTYRWNDDQTDAELVAREGAVRVFEVNDREAPGSSRRIEWRFSARSECMVCHTPKSSTVLGFRAQQLALATNEQSGQTLLETFQQLGYFQQPPKPPKSPAPPHAAMADLDQSARHYLHVNCSHCHQTGGASAATFDVRDELAHDKMNLISMPPTQGQLGLRNAALVEPGQPFRSVLLYRMAKAGAGHMPPIGTSAIDASGLRLMHDWILALGGQSPDAASSPDAGDPMAMALAKVMELDRSTLPPEGRSDAARKFIQAHPDGSVRDLLERFLPAGERLEKLGANPSPAAILALPGDPQRGRQIFLSEGGLQCANCHKMGTEGRSIGPDLTGIGARLSREQILQSLLEPSRVIAPEWILQTVDARDGSTYSGFVLHRTEAQLTLRGVDGSDIRLPMSGIDRLTASQVSLMPEGLLAGLTAQEAADLIAFLAVQR